MVIEDYVIKGQTLAQKNNKQLFKNSKTGKMFITSSNAVKEWQESAAWQLNGKKAWKGRVIVGYTFYCKDNRRRDLDNMIATVNDALVKAGIVEDDNWQTLSIGIAKGCIDKENPRAEIEIWQDERSG